MENHKIGMKCNNAHLIKTSIFYIQGMLSAVDFMLFCIEMKRLKIYPVTLYNTKHLSMLINRIFTLIGHAGKGSRNDAGYG